MSEHQPRSEETYQERRDRVLKQLEDGDIDDRAAMRLMRAGLPWKDWLIHDFLRYWYIIGAMALDFAVVLFIVDTVDASDAVVALTGIGAFALMAFGEILLYLRTWPYGPFTKWKKSRRRLRRMLE